MGDQQNTNLENSSTGFETSTSLLPQTESKTIKCLANNFTNVYEKDLFTIKSDLLELINRQNKLENDLVMENNNYSEGCSPVPLEMQNSIKMYKEKLIAIKKQMVNIHHRTTNLKKRAATLQEVKTKQIENKIQQRHHEEALIAKTSP